MLIKAFLYAVIQRFCWTGIRSVYIKLLQCPFFSEDGNQSLFLFLSYAMILNAKRYFTILFMIITYFGGECVKVQFGDTVLAFNPPSRDSKLKAPRFGADVVFSTVAHKDFNGVDIVSHGERRPFIIAGPGEYEIKGVVVRGFATESEYDLPAQAGGVKRINTVYTVILEGMKICFLGALSTVRIPSALQEALDEIDILFVPIGGDGVLSPEEACAFAVSLEPRIIIPIHFAGVGQTQAIKLFLRESGEKESAFQEKLTIRKKDTEGKEGEIALLKAQS